MTSDELVSEFGNCRESRHVIITPGQPFSGRPASQRAIDSFRCKKGFAIWLDESNRAFELFDGNLRKPICCFLVGYIINFARGDFAPAFNPAFAKMTFPVPNHERLGRGVGNAQAH